MGRPFGQQDPEERTDVEFRFDLDGSVVQFDDVFGERQTDADAFLGGGVVRGLIETLEDAGLFVAGDADSVVLDEDCDLVLPLFAGEGHLARTFAGVLEGVV